MNLQVCKDLKEEKAIEEYLAVKVLDAQPPRTYTSHTKKGKKKTMLVTTVGDDTAFAECIVYDASKFPLFQQEECIFINEFIVKEDSTLVITTKTNVFSGGKDAVIVPDKILQESTGSKEMDIITASLSPKKTTLSVSGKIVAVSPETTKRLHDTKEEIPFKRLKVKDQSGSVNVALWRDIAGTVVGKGDFASFKNFRTTSTFDRNTQKQKPVLSSKPSGSSIVFIAPFAEISDEEDSESEPDSQLVGQIIGVQSAYLYRCCINDKWSKKNLLNSYLCETCRIQFSSQSAGYGAVCKMLLKTDKLMTVTSFTDSTKELLASVEENNDLIDERATLTSLKKHLPIKVAYRLRGDKVQSIKAIST